MGDSGSNQAVFIIDMQEAYIGEKSRYGYDADKLIPAVNLRIAEAEHNRALIVYVKNATARKTGRFVPEFVKGLLILSEHVVEKNTASVFSCEPLHDLLHSHCIEQIEVIGIDGNCCVASSALDAAQAGYAVRFPVQYIGIRNGERFRKTRERLLKAGVLIID